MAIGKALGILMLGLAAIPLAACSSSVQLSSNGPAQLQEDGGRGAGPGVRDTSPSPREGERG